MPRVLYDHLLTESGFDLLTEAGDELATRMVGIAGDATASGGLPGEVAGTGRMVLRGTCTATGTAGSATGTGRVTLVGNATAAGGTGEVAGTGRVVDAEPQAEPVKRRRKVVVVLDEPPPQKVLRGTCTASGGPPGQATGTGRMIPEKSMDNPLWVKRLLEEDEFWLMAA
jgi:hypothetical protein